MISDEPDACGGFATQHGVGGHVDWDKIGEPEDMTLHAKAMAIVQEELRDARRKGLKVSLLLLGDDIVGAMDDLGADILDSRTVSLRLFGVPIVYVPGDYGARAVEQRKFIWLTTDSPGFFKNLNPTRKPC